MLFDNCKNALKEDYMTKTQTFILLAKSEMQVFLQEILETLVVLLIFFFFFFFAFPSSL